MLNWFKDIPKPIWIFAAIWFMAGCFQAACMDLHPDEAYQWNLSKLLDWGYFHHPPMIVVFIKAGYAIFQNELGVRLMTVVASTAGIPILFKLSETSNIRTFVLVFLGFILTHAGVFMAAPDSPLVFFALLFLLALKKYISNDSYLLAGILGLIVAAMMYSKYHAIIFLASALIAVPSLLLRKSFWLIVIVSVAVFLPHVLWQFDHDLVSYKFNWVIREKSVWKPIILLDYLFGQLLLLGPVGILLVMAIWKSKIGGDFNRVLKSITIGVFGFFLVMSLRGKVEANWTALAFLPVIILGARTLPQHPKLSRVFTPVAWSFIAILIVARCYLASPWAGKGLPTVFPLKGWETWARAIKEKANGKPVFFPNSYQLVGQYSFYSGEQGYHFSPLNYNGNQYELWDIDRQHYGEDFALFLRPGPDSSMAVEVDGFKTLYCFELENYHSYRNLRFEFEETKYNVLAGETLALTGEIVNRTKETINLDSLLDERPLKIFYYLNGQHSPVEPINCNGCAGILEIGEKKNISINVRIPEEHSKYFIRFGLDFELGMAEQNSDFIQLKVNKNE